MRNVAVYALVMNKRMNGSAMLRAWIGERRHNYVAKLLNVEPSHLSHWVCGRRSPNLSNACLIEQLTDGAVPVAAWSKK